jgi:phosphatidylglycerophosphate synthase
VLDRRARAMVARPLERGAQRLAGAGVSANAVTAVGFGLGVAACVAAATEQWIAALGLWLANRVADGLDGPVARLRGTTAAGGFADIMADFTVYGGFVLAVAIARPEARLACLALFFAYYVSGVAFLAWSATAEQLRRERPDERSLHFVGGIAEGTETIVVYTLFCLVPGRAELIAWAFAAGVAVTAIQRVAFVRGALSHLAGPPG